MGFIPRKKTNGSKLELEVSFLDLVDVSLHSKQIWKPQFLKVI